MEIEDIIEIEGQLTIEIPELTKTMYLPLQLHYCNEKQYIAMCELIYRLEAGDLDLNQFKILSVYKLLGIEKGKRNIEEEQIDEALDNIRIIADYITEYFEESEEGKLSLILQYKKNHIEAVTPNTKKYWGPKHFFTNTTFGEYEEALNLFMEYNDVKEIEILQRLFAIFYREKKNHKPIPYVSEDLDEHLKNFKKTPIGVLYGFYYTFAAFHTYFTSSEVYWEGKRIDMSIIFSEQEEDSEDDKTDSPYPSLGMKSIAYQLAESGVFGSLTEVRATNLWEAALRLYDVRKRDLDHKAAQKATKPTT